MKKEESSSNLFKSIWKFFSSIRLTVFILLALPAFSIIGTVIPQNEAADAYLHEYGRLLHGLFSFLGVYDLYHSWWYQLLLVLLMTNIIVCSLDRLKFVSKIVFAESPNYKLSRMRSQTTGEKFETASDPERTAQACKKVLASKYAKEEIQTTENGFAVFAEKGRWTRLGVYGVHFSIVVLLIGGLIGAIFGFEGHVNIAEESAQQSIRLKNGKIQPLEFAIQCDDFYIEFYDTGAPKIFRSTLTLVKDGKNLITEDIRINHPLRYGGLNIFLSAYGPLDPRSFTLTFESRDSRMAYTKRTTYDKPIELPENMGTFVVKDYSNAYAFMGHNIGEALIAEWTSPEGKKTQIVVSLRFPGFDKMRKGEFAVSVADYDSRYYTVLQVTKDPGVWVVYSGFILMIIGIFVTFFMSHQTVCVEVAKTDSSKGESGSVVIVRGTANKNRLGMERDVKALARHLSESFSSPEPE